MLATRALGSAAAAPVSVLWTYWSFAAASLTFPLQHWIAQSVAAHRSEGRVHDAMPRVAAAVVVAAIASGVLAWFGREPLFHRGDAWFPLLVAWVTLGSGLIGVVRGGLSARRRFMDVAWALVAENALRCLAATALILAGSNAPLGFGICLAVGSLIAVFWPSSLRFSADERDVGAESPLAFLGAAAGGQLIGQAILTGGPVLLALSGGSAEAVTVLFAVLALFRAPYTLGLGLVSQLTGRLTTLVVEGEKVALHRVRVLMNVSTLVVVVVAGAIGALTGPVLLPLIFGTDVEIAWLPSTLVAIGSALAVANLVRTVSIMAQSRSHAVARAWIVASLGGGLAFLAISDSPLARVCWVFVAAESVAFLALVLEELRGSAKLASRATRTPGAATSGGSL
ncbi:MAG: hypothetical protein H0V07_02710 [Propionibacteriales bacterium]|nr:hypothetical protein [Propionibacteriales bacterium]